MTNISRDVRKAIESGSASYAVVEANNNGFITVTVVGSRARLTNLEFMGAYPPVEGAKVIVDYSAGDKPVVRPIEREYIGSTHEYEMQTATEIVGVDPGVLVGSVDVGVGCTVNANGFIFPNEPHEPHETWIQYWGYNAAGWTSSIYDTLTMYGEPVIVGQQYFNINLNGKYLLTFHTSLSLAGGSYSGDPYGTLTAFIYRLGAYGPFPIMVGTATAAGYNNYYNIDISKLIYLPLGDQVYVELMYTGGVNSYYLKNSTNPLKWLAAGNDLIFKAQLIAEATIIEPPPEVAEYEGWAKRWGYTGTIMENGGDTSTKDLTGFSLENWNVETVAENTPNGLAEPISDNEFIYLITNDQIYGQYQMWKIDPDEEAAVFIEVADGALIEAANYHSVSSEGIVNYIWYQLFSWGGGVEATAMTVEYNYMDWNAGETESEIETIESFDVPWAPPLSSADWMWGKQNKTTGGFLTVEPFPPLGNVGSWDDTNYVIAMAVKAYRTASWSYYSQGIRWRVYDVATGTPTDLDHTYSNENYGIITNSGWFQHESKLYTFVNRYYGFGTVLAAEVHVIDLNTMTLTVHDITSDLPTGYTHLSNPVFDHVRGRMYATEGEGVIHAAPHGDGLIYWDIETYDYVTVHDNPPGTGELPPGYSIAYNKYNVYADPAESPIYWEYFNANSTSQEIDCGSQDDNIFVCPQVSSDEERIWVLDLTAGSRKLIGYHRLLEERELSLENTAIGDLPDVQWAARINIIGNAFIITANHSTQGNHTFIIKPRI